MGSFFLFFTPEPVTVTAIHNFFLVKLLRIYTPMGPKSR